MSVKSAAKHKRVISAFLGNNWAIDPQWLDNAWAVFQGTNGNFKASEQEDQAVLRTIAGERPQGTRYTVIPQNSRVAVIEVWGAITCRANFMSEWSGGTSSELLVKDIKAAASNPMIDEVIFLMHSPGGDVVGVTEVNDAILELNKKKDTTAYVKGTCASACFWIASACKKRIAARTAQIGSIGVYSVYMDDTEQLKQRGLKEHVFKSDQSPNKNADPASPEGAKLIQVRMNDLCDVFIGDVAKNMKISAKTVQEKFGQGDVMTAGRALKAGMIDEIASFDYDLGAIVRTDGSENFSDDDDMEVKNGASAETPAAAAAAAAAAGDPSASARGENPKTDPTQSAETLNFAAEVNSQKSAETDESSAQISDPNSDHNSNKNGEVMKNEEQKNQADNTDTAEDKNKSDAAATATDSKPAETQKSAAAGEKSKVEESAKSGDAPQVVSMEEFQALQKKFAASQAQVETLTAKDLKNDLENVAKGFSGETAKHVSMLTSLTSAFGRDSKEVADYIELQNAAAEKIKTGEMYTEKGKTGAETGNSSLDQLNAKAAEIQKERKLTKAQAFTAACEENEELYNAYRNGQ